MAATVLAAVSDPDHGSLDSGDCRAFALVTDDTAVLCDRDRPIFEHR